VKRILLLLFFFCCVLSSSGFARLLQAPQKFAIASSSVIATSVAEKVLQSGGNAFDAAVALTAALAVVEPWGSGLGGGGFWLLHEALTLKEVVVDGRERAPGAASASMYLDKQGKLIQGLSIDGPLSAAIPGVPAALVYLAKHYGRLPLSKLLEPAIGLARDGFLVNEQYRRFVSSRLKTLQKFPKTASQFLNEFKVPPVGFKIVQLDLANTLSLLSSQGVSGFYSGVVAKELVSSVRAAGGIWTLEDLKSYEIKLREPLVGEYQGLKITTMPPPSAGGMTVLVALNVLSHFDLSSYSDLDRTHLIVEAMRRGFVDRAVLLGDPDFVKIPMKRLLSKERAAQLASSIQIDKASLLSNLSQEALVPKGTNTTHFSILDSAGNRVAATLSVNFPFGSGFVASNTGVLLNNEMDDFVAKPGVANSYGLVGGVANEIEPNKRPLSSMTPTFFETKRYVGILGTPGGSRIPTMVLLAILDFVRGAYQPASWVYRSRYHHQLIPDKVEYELNGLSLRLVEGLRNKGHVVSEVSYHYGDMQAILWDKQTNLVSAASDPRDNGRALVK